MIACNLQLNLPGVLPREVTRIALKGVPRLLAAPEYDALLGLPQLKSSSTGLLMMKGHPG